MCLLYVYVRAFVFIHLLLPPFFFAVYLIECACACVFMCVHISVEKRSFTLPSPHPVLSLCPPQFSTVGIYSPGNLGYHLWESTIVPICCQLLSHLVKYLQKKKIEEKVALLQDVRIVHNDCCEMGVW